jgi:twinkle protein
VDTEIIEYFRKRTGNTITIPPHYGRDNVNVKCPFCSDGRKNQNDRALFLNVKTGAYKCFHCEKKGMAKEQEEKYKRPDNLWTVIKPAVAEFLTKERCLPASILDLNIIGSATGQGGVMWLTFNYFKQGRHVNTKYRKITEKAFKLEAGAELCLYNGDCLKIAQTEAIITEGEIDALSWIAIGSLFTVSVPNGASENTSYLDDYIQDFDKIDKIYLSTDQEESKKGYNLAISLANRLGREKCFLVEYPDNLKDANDVLKAYGYEVGKQILLECKAAAKPFPLDGVDTVQDHLEESYSYLINGYPDTYDIEIPGLSGIFSVFPGEVTIITGAPGAGKSNLVDALSIQLSRLYQMRGAIVSGETDPPLHITRLSKKYKGKERLDNIEAMEALGFLNDHIYYITRSDGLYHLDEILKKAKDLVRSRGINYLVIDNLSTVDTTGTRSDNDIAKEFMVKLTNFSKHYRIAIFLVAHPRKLQENGEGFYVVPSGYEISGSAQYYNLTDNIIAMALRDGYVDIATRKIRNAEFVGRIGTAQLAFRRDLGGNYTYFNYAGAAQTQQTKLVRIFDEDINF